MHGDRSRLSIERCAEGIDHAPEEPIADGHRRSSCMAPYACAWLDSLRGAERSAEQSTVPESEHLDEQRVFRSLDLEALSRRSRHPCDFDQEPDDLVNSALGARSFRTTYALEIRL